MSRTKAITTSAWSCSKPTSAACLLLPTADVGNNKRKNFHAAETFASASLHRGHCLIKRKGPCILHQIIQPFCSYICVLLDHKKLERLTKLKQTYLKNFFEKAMMANFMAKPTWSNGVRTCLHGHFPLAQPHFGPRLLNAHPFFWNTSFTFDSWLFGKTKI